MQTLENRRLMAACITMEPVLNDMGRFGVFADFRVKIAVRMVWFLYLLAFPVMEIGLTCVGVCEWKFMERRGVYLQGTPTIK